MQSTDADAPDLREVHELKEEALDRFQIEDEDDPNIVRTFREQLKLELEAGTEVPYAFAMRE